MQEKNEAFAAAIRELCRQHPYESKYPKVTRRVASNRELAFMLARQGDRGIAIMCCDHVPHKQLEALAQLLFG